MLNLWAEHGPRPLGVFFDHPVDPIGDLLDGLSKQVLTIYFLLCWRDSALRLAGKQKERFAAASEGLTIEQYRAMHPAYREDKENDNHD